MIACALIQKVIVPFVAKNNEYCSGVPFPVYCDMVNDGGGWAMAVLITGQ